jgi:CheY-like chemotaxis protein
MAKILVVDDELSVCFTIRVLLEQNGFEVSISDGGISGLKRLEESTFDLMIVDIFMPNMRGFESIRIFHERAPIVPLIAISGYAFAINSPTPDFYENGSRAWSGALPAKAVRTR